MWVDIIGNLLVIKVINYIVVIKGMSGRIVRNIRWINIKYSDI